jgi:hypothetical protein
MTVNGEHLAWTGPWLFFLLTGADKIEPARSSTFAVILLGMRSLELLRHRVGVSNLLIFYRRSESA